MSNRTDIVYDTEDVTPDRLRHLLNSITYHFCANKQAMRKTQDILLSLIGEFVNDEMKRYRDERKLPKVR